MSTRSSRALIAALILLAGGLAWPTKPAKAASDWRAHADALAAQGALVEAAAGRMLDGASQGGVLGRGPVTEATARLDVEIAEFVRAARAAAARIDASGGPHDLACIGRGMADDAQRRWSAARTGSARQAAEELAALGALARDAQEIFAGADGWTFAPNANGGPEGPAACHAKPLNLAAPYSFTLQP